MNHINPFKQINRDSRTASPWQHNLPNLHEAYEVDKSLKVYDAIIIGAGITGVTTAFLLQKAGKKCILIEGENIGFGTTGGTTAHINTFFDADYRKIEKDFGENAAKKVASAGKGALNLIKSLIDEFEIKCDFEYKTAFLYTENQQENDQLIQILEASKKAGIKVEEAKENGVPIPFEKSISYLNQAQFHPLKYIYGLAKEFVKIGGEVLEHTFISGSKYKDDIHTVKSDKIAIKGKNLVYATHIPPTINILHLRCAPYRSYVIGIKLKNNDYPNCLSYELKDIYHYFRTHEIDGQKYLILGGEDHKTGHGNPEQAFENLENFAKKYFEIDQVEYKWSSQFYQSADGLPYIGELPAASEQTFVATGFTGNGMTFGTISAQILSDLILGKENPYSELFRPSRIKPIAGFANFVKENSDVVYHFITDRFDADDIDSISELKPNQGLIVNFQNKKIAIYKNNNGEVCALHPVCTHAGCIVNFNEVEKSWDCPCHGGRYDIEGKVLTGPPRKNLQQIVLHKK